MAVENFYNSNGDNKTDIDNQIEYLNTKIEEIDKRLADMSLTQEQREVLVDERNGYSDQYDELELNIGEDEDECGGDDCKCECEHKCACEICEIGFESIYFKYCFEDCETIDDVITRLESLKTEFQELKNNGHKLIRKVDSGYCFIDKLYRYN